MSLPASSLAAVLIKPGEFELRSFKLPEIGPSEALIKVRAVGICGTDVSVYEGRFKLWPIPLILGHEVVGEVVKAGQKFVKDYGVDVGDYVTVDPYIPCNNCEYCRMGLDQLCRRRRAYGAISVNEPPHLWGGYSEFMYIAPNSKLHKVPENIPPEVACLSSIMGNAVRWVITKGSVKAGDTVVVLGPGAQGLLSTLVAKYVGAGQVILVGLTKDSRRLEIGKVLGADHVVYADKEDVIERVKELTGGAMADVVIACAPSTSAIELGLEVVKPSGKYVIIANTEGRKSSIETDKIVWREITILGGLGQSWSDVEIGLKIMKLKYDLISKIVTHKFPLTKVKEALEAAKSGEAIKVVITP
jgi:threonine dehydrogenase-like Zn-dependent dehydrogenase